MTATPDGTLETRPGSPPPDIRGRTEDMPRVPVRRYGRWLSAALLAAVMAWLAGAFARGDIAWDVVGQYLTAAGIMRGLVNTVVITVVSMALGVVAGTGVALLRLSDNPVASSVGAAYVWFFRGVPVLLQLLLWYNIALVFPTLGIPGLVEARTIDVMTPFVATLLGLGIHQSAYTAEIVRAGILSVDDGQLEAAHSLGMGTMRIRRRIVLPQAMRVIVPPLGNEVISTLKTSSLAAVITYGEILQSAQLIYYVNNRVIELLIVASVWYLVVVSALSIGQHFVERRFGRGFARRTVGGAR